MQTKITINLPDEDETLASTAVVRQSHTLLYRSLAVHEPTVVFVRRGRKKLRWAGRELVVEAGGAAALAGWQTFDVMNEPDEGGLYHVRRRQLLPELAAAFAPPPRRKLYQLLHKFIPV